MRALLGGAVRASHFDHLPEYATERPEIGFAFVLNRSYQNLGRALFLAETHMNIKFSLIKEGLVGLLGL